MDHGIFNMHTDVNVCNCTWECMDTVESALKVNCGRKSLAAPGNSTCIGSVPIRCSTNRATAPPHFVSVQNFSFSVVWHLVWWPTCYSTMVCSVLQLVWGGDVDQLVESDILYTLFGRITSDRHAADTCSIPRCGKGFFSQSKLLVQTLLQCPYTPMCNHMHLHLCPR